MIGRRGLGALVAALLLGGPSVPGLTGPGPDAAQAAGPALCGKEDRPETGLQGDVPRADQQSGRAKQGYNCGLALVGSTTLDADGRTDGAFNMAWAKDCAYVAGSTLTFANQTDAVRPFDKAGLGVAVVDVRDPAKPKHVRTLTTPGALRTGETLHAVTTKSGRAVLAVGEYGNFSEDGPTDVYDVTDCTRPKLLQTVHWPENAHNLTLTPDGRYLYATQPVQAFDLAPLYDRDPRTGAVYLGNIEDDLGPTPGAVPNIGGFKPGGHEVWPLAGDRIMVGTQTPESQSIYVVDMRDWLRRDARNRPAGPPRVLSQERGLPGHSIRTGTVGGKRLALHSDESVFNTAYGCLTEHPAPFAGVAEGYLSDYSDLADPAPAVGRLRLQINDPLNCRAQLDSRTQASVHYNDLDSETDTRFAMLSMQNAGVRVFDVRDPRTPREVAYFNPGDVGKGRTVLDSAAGHVRYRPDTGHLWFATRSGGFWVVELEPQVRRHLGLDARDGKAPVRHPDGRPGRTGGVALAALAQLPDFRCSTSGWTSAAMAPLP